MATISYKAPDGTTSVSHAGVETPVVDGIVTLPDAPSALHSYLTNVLKFVVATEADIEGIFDSKAARTEKAELVAQMQAVGLKVDGRGSLSYIQGQYNAAVERGLIKVTPPLVTPDQAAATTPADVAPATIGSGSLTLKSDG